LILAFLGINSAVVDRNAGALSGRYVGWFIAFTVLPLVAGGAAALYVRATARRAG